MSTSQPESERACNERRSSSLETAFVYGCWAILSLAALGFVARYGSPFPYFDDFDVLDAYANRGEEGFRILFRPVLGSHVIPVTRLATVETWRATDGDLRPLLVANVVVMSIATIVTLLLVRRIRGFNRLDDVVIPLTLLGSYAWPDYIWAILTSGLLGRGLQACLTAGLVLYAVRPRWWGFYLLLVGVSLLALQGGPGILAAVGFVPALTILCLRRIESPNQRPQRAPLGNFIGLLLCTSVILTLLALYFLAPGGPGNARKTRGMTLASCMQALSLASGNLSHYAWPLGAVFILGVLGSIAVIAVRQSGQLRLRELISLAVLLPCLLAIAALGLLRPGAARTWHIGAVMPLWVGIVLATDFLMSSRARAFVTRSAILVAACSLGLGVQPALFEGHERREATKRLESDIAAGHPLCRIAADNASYWFRTRADLCEGYMSSMRRLGRGSLAHIPTEPVLSFTEISNRPRFHAGCFEHDGQWIVHEGGRMYFCLGEVGADAVRVVVQVSKAPWGATVAGGAMDEEQKLLGPPLVSHTLYPEEHSGVQTKTLSTTFVFASRTKGFVLAPPSDRGAVQILRLEVGEYQWSSTQAVNHATDNPGSTSVDIQDAETH